MAEDRELLDTLEKVLERLYAGYNLYGAIIYLAFGVATALFVLVAMTPWFQSLSGRGSTIASIVYWGLAIIIVGYVSKHYGKSYISRLEARLGRRAERGRRCGLLSAAAWASFPATMMAAWLVASMLGRGGAYASAFSVLFALGVGNLGNALMEKCYGGELVNPPMIAALLLFLGSPLALLSGWGYAAMLIILAYTLAALGYVYNALKKIA